MLAIPFGGPLLPIITAVFGAGFGALSGSLSDYGIDEAIFTTGKADYKWAREVAEKQAASSDADS